MSGRVAETAAVAALAVGLTLCIAAPVLRAPSERIFGMAIVGRHHDPFTAMEHFARSAFARRLLAAAHRPPRRAAVAVARARCRVQLARASHVSPCCRRRLSPGAPFRAVAAGLPHFLRWRSPSRRFTSRTPRTILTSRRRNGCRCTSSRCGDAWTTRRLPPRAPRRCGGGGRAVQFLRRVDRRSHHAGRHRRSLGLHHAGDIPLPQSLGDNRQRCCDRRWRSGLCVVGRACRGGEPCGLRFRPIGSVSIQREVVELHGSRGGKPSPWTASRTYLGRGRRARGLAGTTGHAWLGRRHAGCDRGDPGRRAGAPEPQSRRGPLADDVAIAALVCSLSPERQSAIGLSCVRQRCCINSCPCSAPMRGSAWSCS